MGKEQLDTDTILKNAEARGNEWLAALKFDGKHDKEVILRELNNRTFEGEKVTAFFADSPAQAVEVLRMIFLTVACEEVGMKYEDFNEKAKGAKKILNRANEIFNEIKPYSCIWDYYLMAFYDCAYSQCPVQDNEFARQSFFDAFKAGLGFIINLGPTIVGIGLPEAHRDDQLRIHREDGPAIVWGPEKQYWIRGVRVPDYVVEAPETLTPKHIDEESNAEVRRIMLEKYGFSNYLQNSKSTLISEDQYGKLWRKEIRDDEPIVMVELINSTAEPDGTFKKYFLRVPPAIKTAREAVAWSFDMKEEQYMPLQET